MISCRRPGKCELRCRCEGRQWCAGGHPGASWRWRRGIGGRTVRRWRVSWPRCAGGQRCPGGRRRRRAGRGTRGRSGRPHLGREGRGEGGTLGGGRSSPGGDGRLGSQVGRVGPQIVGSYHNDQPPDDHDIQSDQQCDKCCPLPGLKVRHIY
jgi:hypothetical protein